ncbi:MAG: transglutaminase domain-containing protein, partial [Sphaerochaetaceae bacterium]|nr:transglutaminase domain-containing protein [Sphaerochaetaceae bacterium]
MIKLNKKILCIILLLFFLPFDIFSSSYYYESLENDEKIIYNDIYKSLIKKEEYLEVGNIDFDLLSKIYFFVLNDYPALFYVSETLNYSSSLLEDKLISAKIIFNYKDIDDISINKKQEELNSILDKIEQDVVGYSDFEIVKYVYDYLINNSYYDQNFRDQSLLSILLDNIGLCTSYAKSFKFIMDHFDIECLLVEGKFVNQEESHVWNMVKLDDSWYHVDVTQGDATNRFVDYSYLCITDKQIQKDHIILSNVTLPKANATSYFYLKNRGAYFTSFDKQKVENGIDKYIENNENIFILSFENSLSFKQAKQYLIDENGFSKILLINGYQSNVINYYENDLNNTLIIINEKKMIPIDIIYFKQYSISILKNKIKEVY